MWEGAELKEAKAYRSSDAFRPVFNAERKPYKGDHYLPVISIELTGTVRKIA